MREIGSNRIGLTCGLQWSLYDTGSLDAMPLLSVRSIVTTLEVLMLVSTFDRNDVLALQNTLSRIKREFDALDLTCSCPPDGACSICEIKYLLDESTPTVFEDTDVLIPRNAD